MIRKGKIMKSLETLKTLIDEMINPVAAAPITYKMFVDLMNAISHEENYRLHNLYNIARCIEEYEGIDVLKYNQFKAYIDCWYYNSVGEFQIEWNQKNNK